MLELVGFSRSLAILGCALQGYRGNLSCSRNKICRECHGGVPISTRALRSCRVGAEHLRDCIHGRPNLQQLRLVKCTVPSRAFELMPSLLTFRSISLDDWANEFESTPTLTAEQLHCVGQLTNLQDLSLTSNAASHIPRSAYVALPAYSGMSSFHDSGQSGKL